MRVSASIATLVAILVLGGIQPATAQWGTIRGQVTVSGTVAASPALVKKGDVDVKDSAICAAAEIPDESLIVDPKTNGLANVIVYLKQMPATIHPDLLKKPIEDAVVRQVGCRFVPHVTVMRTDQTLRILPDKTSHNPHPYALKNAPRSFVIPPSSEDYVVTYLERAESLPLRVLCDIHPWMKCWVVVQDHPYVAVTNERGEFEIANLPAGDHDFTVWHERSGYIQKSLRIKVREEIQKIAPIQVQAETLMPSK